MAREDVLKYPQRKRNLRPLFYEAVSDTRLLMVITKFKNTPKIELLLKKSPWQFQEHTSARHPLGGCTDQYRAAQLL